MKKIAVYGAGKKALDVEYIIAEYLKGEAECCYAVENKQKQKIGTYMQSKLDAEKRMEVISLDECEKKYKKKEIDGIVFPTSYHIFDWKEIYGLCREHGIEEKDIFAVPIDILRKKQLNGEDTDRILITYKNLVQLYHLDIHIIDYCNIKCKGCAHFSSMAGKDDIVSLEDLQNNLERLKKLVPNISHIALLGGEPLLHPQLGEIVKSTKEVYPYAAVGIVTNGILLPNMTEECLNTVKKYDVSFGISLYPPFQKMEAQWMQLLEEHNIPYKISYCNEFERRLWKEPVFDGKVMTQKCGHDLCMRKQYISRCPMIACINYYNEYFNENFPDNGKVDLYEVESGKALMEQLEKPSGLCDYCCARDQCLEPWESVTVKTIRADDWFMTNINHFLNT